MAAISSTDAKPNYSSLNNPELFTCLNCCIGKEVAHEAVENYREWATMQPML
jgi:hypothetical protein